MQINFLFLVRKNIYFATKYRNWGLNNKKGIRHKSVGVDDMFLESNLKLMYIHE